MSYDKLAYADELYARCILARAYLEDLSIPHELPLEEYGWSDHHIKPPTFGIGENDFTFLQSGQDKTTVWL